MEEEKKQAKPRYRKDGREVVPWRTFGACDFVNPYGLCVKKKPRERTPEYDKPREGCAIIEPKVNEPYEPIPRRITRKDLLKKIRETFSKAEIAQVLKKSFNIDFSIPDQSKLNLPFFDDKQYEIYPNELWLSKAKDKHTGRQLKLMVKILLFNETNKTGSWHRGMVSSYNKDTETYCGNLDNEDKTPFVNLPKIQILFDAENPYVYAKRIFEAMKLRSKCESKIKYNYYLRKIPKYTVTELPKNRMEEILEKVQILPECHLIEDQIDEQIKSVNDNYIFQLNKLMFDDLYFKQKSVELCCINLKIEPPPIEPVPLFAKEMIYKDNKEFNYQNQQKSFELNSLQCKENIITGIFKIKQKMNSIINECSLYQTHFSSTVRLEEFMKEQKKTISEFKKKIDSDIIESIKAVLSDLQYKPKNSEEDDLDIPNNKLIDLSILIDFIANRPPKARKHSIKADEEREKEQENFMIQLNNYKTIHLLKKVNLMMRDSLYNTVVKSMIDFVSFFEMNVPLETTIVNTNTVSNKYESPIAEKVVESRIVNIAQSRLNISEDSAFYKSTSTPDVDLNTTYEIINYEPEKEKTEMKIPIFYINLKYKDGEFDYHAQVEDFVLEIRKVFDEGLDKVQKITQLNFDKEKMFSNMKYFDIIKRDKTCLWNNNANMKGKDEKAANANESNVTKTIGNLMNISNSKFNQVGGDQNDQVDKKEDRFNEKKEDNIFVNDLYERLEKSLMKSKEPLVKYLAKFQQYKDDLDIIPEEFVKGLDDDQNMDSSSIVQLLRNDIIKRQNLHDKILNEISEQVHVSYFLVNCKDVRDALLSKHEKIRELELNLLNAKSQEIKTGVFKQIEEIKNGITKQSKNIEELVEVEKYIEDVPNMLATIKLDIDSCLQIYKISDEFLQKVQYMDLRTRFMLIQSTTEIVNTISTAKTLLSKQRERFYDNLLENQKVLKEDIYHLQKQIKELMTYKTIDQLQEASALSTTCESTLKDCQERAKLANSREVNFNKEQTDYSKLSELFKDFEPFYLIWTSIDLFETKSQEYVNTDLKTLKGIEVQEMNDNVKKNLVLSIKKLKDREGYERIIQTAETEKIKSDHFGNIAKLAVSLTTEGLQDRHWEELKEATTIDCTDPNTPITLNLITNSVSLNNEIISHAQGIADKASREYQIKRKLVELDERWSAIEFVLLAYRIKGIFIIGGWGDIYKDLDNDVQEVQQLEVNQFKAHFIDEISDWSKSFQNITDILEALSKLQSKWVQLQPIFESPDIMKSIPHYASIFAKADKSYKDIVRGMKDSTNVKVVCNKEGLLVKINESNEWLEQVEKGLNDYIDKKKLLFPRFYFLSNENLLKILSETKDLNRVKENLKNIFENIHNIELKDDKHILKMISNLGEEVPLKESISIERKNIEKWMLELEEVMFATVRACIEKALSSYNRPPGKDWIFGHSGQSIIHSNQNQWTVQVEESLAQGNIAEYCDEIQNRINLLVTILRDPLTRVKGITVFNLLTLEVHNKEITEIFRVGDYNIFSFEWKKQLRYYWEKNDMFVKSIQTSFPYGYEYLGNTEILVITPLTDKCYLTLMGALKFNMGGAPAGPAGTGKTESTKDLAKAIAKQCVVYNCSEETDFVAVAAFFKGLACCGAWICFDEFNRINIEVLSVIASQLIVLFTAKAAGEEKIVFEKTPIRILPTFCVFITMNPDYEGRTALPDNLVALFRPMAMMVPDYKLISEVYLYSSGYLQAKDLAKKIVSTFKLSSEQLSSQSHYDFGMRAVKSVLYAAKKLKRNSPDIPEDKLLLRALQDVNIPKFLKEDIPLFQNIIKDLFPKTEKPTSDLGDLIEKLKENCVGERLQPHENFIGKIIQLYDTIQVRHGLMIVGPTGGGKSSNWKLLKKSLSDLNDGERFFTTKATVINPKAVRKPELYCDKDPMNPTEWINGIMPILVNDLNKDTSGKTRYWILFDGPVDTFWIEDMNSVLDDSRRLCLPSSAIIVLNETITMMFEVEDLVHASPATVSRCGMVFMEPGAIGLMPLVESWLDNKLPYCIKTCTDNDIQGRLRELFTNCLEENILFIRKKVKEPCPTTDVNLTSSLMKLLECYLDKFKDSSKNTQLDLDLAILHKNIFFLYFFCTVWSIGITSSEEGRKNFNTYLREFMKEKVPEDVYFPDEGTIYDYFFDYENDQWKSWESILTFPPIEARAEYTDIIIPTIDSVRYNYIIKLLLVNNKHLITTGPTGTGKTVNMMDVISRQMGDKFIQLVINFSAQTTASQTQLTIDKMLKRKARGKFAPDNNKIMIVFVDDLNMPKKEKYEAQPPIEILRQWLDYEGWYDIREKEKPFMTVMNLMLTGAMGPPGGGRSFLTNRFMRHFNLITYTELVDSSIKSIFERKVNYFLSRFSVEAKNLVPSIVASTLILYKEIKDKLLPIPKSSHYLFNLRDMSKVLQGVCSASSKHTTKKIDMVRIWLHEMIRSFGDRLICTEDRNFLKGILESNIKEAAEFEVTDVTELYNGVDKMIFCDFIGGTDRPYIQVTNVKDFITKIEDKLQEFNDIFKNKSMPLVMFLDACDHVARISRIIRQTQGHALLLGVGGSGRQSIARLSSYINYSMDCTTIEVIKGYKINDFRKNVKDFLKESGVKKKQNCFLICDTQIFDEIMLEDINNCLNSGDIPDIYKTDDYEEIKEAVKTDMKAKGFADNQTNMMTVYLKRVLANIHFIIAMSPVGDQFVTRLRMFPSLVNCCTIDWFTEWPEEALKSVAKDILEKRDDLYLGKSFNGSIDTIKYIHKSVEKISVNFLNELRRYNYLTPTSFLEFLSLFQNILLLKTKENELLIQRYDMGLKVLQFAEENISIIEQEIKRSEPKLTQLSKDTEILVKDLEIKKKEADKVRDKASKDSEVAEELATKISKIEAECRRELSKAEAELQSSLAKIDKIQDNELREIARYQNYGEKLIKTLEIILTFRYGDAWRKKKENMTEPTGDPKNPFRISYKQTAINDLHVTEPEQFKSYFYSFKDEQRRDQLKNNEFDKVKLTEQLIEKTNATIAMVSDASKAVVPCFEFILGMIEFCHKSIEIVDPKKKEAEKAKGEKAEADEKLAIAQAALNKAVTESVALEKKYTETLKEKNQLAATLRENQIKVTRAKQLVALLSSEKARWGESVKKLQNYSNYLIGDCIIAAASIAYCGPFISTYRKSLEEMWREKLDTEKILRSNDVSLRSVMEDPIKTRKWNLSMLPNDNLSIENGIIMFKTSKWPLMIDPQNQASIFLKKYGHDQKSTSFQPVKITDPKMVDYVISGVKYGSWIMLDNVGLSLDNALEPILLRQQVKNKFSNFYEIKIGEKVIPFSEEFRLFMVTTMSNPHYSPETFAKITIINFAITEIGLEDQMLSELVRIERPDLEESKNKILEENFINQESLKKIEDQILENLSNNKDNIEETLKSNELIEILTESKNKSKIISEKMIESEKTGREIDKGRETYRDSAKRASLLFFSLLDLSMIEPMYQFSLIQFKHLYENSVRVLPPCEDTEKRIVDINQTTTKMLYDFTCRSLFERDKPLYSFMMCAKIIIGEQTESNIKIKQSELRFLLAGPSSDLEVVYPNNPTNWISSNDWKTFYLQLKGMTFLGEAFKGIDEDFMNNHDKFFEYYETPKNENSPLPEPFESTLTDFQKLLIIKAVRFDKLANALAYYVEKNLGKEYTEPPTFNLQKSFSDSNKEIPLLFVLSTGSDPKNDFQQLADSMNIKVEYVSLGKSMDKYALVKIDEMKLKGGWILLQNCHLAISFMPQLEDVIEKLQNNPTLDNNFRLCLTSMSSNKFSINVLKSSIKITMEPPKGLKLNLQRQYENIPADELEACSKPELFKAFFFGLCFFHAIVQDRRKFGPIGWNVKYDFTNEDLKVSRMQLKNFLEEYEDVPYKVLNYLVAEINYGGRVTDDKDQRLIKTILMTYLTSDTLSYDAYKYSSSGIYFCPKPGSKTDYLNYIKGLPLATGPEVFGLHDNAEIITAQNDARLLLETMLLMQPRASSGSGKSPEQIVTETLAIVEQNTPAPFDYEAIFKKFPTEYTESMNTVLIQEVIRYNVLLNIMKTNIKNLNAALNGRIVMNDELDRIFTSLYNNQVPTIWITSGFLSLKPLRSWIEDLKSRIEFFTNWYENGTPKCFCLSRFSFPQAFLTGTLQNYARKHGCEIDLLTFEFNILDQTTPDDVNERPENGCLVYGMFFEGAKWNYNGHFLDNSNNRELYTDVPLIHMIPKPNREPPKTGIYNAPLYKVLSRQGTLSTTGHSTNFVLMVELPSKQEESVWTKAGVAMFLALKQ